MYQLFTSLKGQDLALRQLPVFLVSFVIASLFYKFGTFALECLAFLATWAVLDLVVAGILKIATKSEQVDT
jgi:hypothetical protein